MRIEQDRKLSDNALYTHIRGARNTVNISSTISAALEIPQIFAQIFTENLFVYCRWKKIHHDLSEWMKSKNEKMEKIYPPVDR